MYDPGLLHTWAIDYNPRILPLKGIAVTFDTPPFPNEDSPEQVMHVTGVLGPMDWWDAWYAFPSSPEIWLTPENYDP